MNPTRREEESKHDTISIHVEYLGGLEHDLHVPGPFETIELVRPFTIGHFIATLTERIEDFEAFLSEIVFVINGRDSVRAFTRDREIADADTIIIMYVGVGG